MISSVNHRHTFAIALGIVFAAMLIGFQFYFYEVRALVDNSVNLFMISVDKTFHASENRFMKIFTQVLPVVGARLDVPFDWLPALYLANDALWYILGFGVLLFYFKDHEGALALAVGLLATWKYYFFIIPCCLIISWPVQLMYFAMMRRHGFAPKVQSRAFLIMVAMLFFFAFGHPLILFSFLFIYAYEVMGGAQKVALKKLVFPVGLFGAFLIFKWANPEQYDMQQIGQGSFTFQSLADSSVFGSYAWLPYYYPLFCLLVLVVLGLMAWWLKRGEYGRVVVPAGALGLTVFAFFYFQVYNTHLYGDWFQKIIIPLGYLYAYIIADGIRRIEAGQVQRFYKLAALPLLALVLLEGGVITFGSISYYFRERLAKTEVLIQALPNEAHSKYYARANDFEQGSVSRIISPMEVVVVAALKYDREYTPNVLVVSPEEEAALPSFCHDNFFINYIDMGHIKHLHDVNVAHNYLPGEYRYLPVANGL